MKKYKYIIIVISVFLLTGCWDYRELEDFAVVGGIGVDMADGEYSISVEVLNNKKISGSSSSGGSSSGDETSSTVYKANGKTIRETLNKIVLDSPKKLYIGHMNLLIVSDEVARKGMNNIIDFFMRDTEARKIFPLVVVENAKASDTLEIVTPIISVTSQNVKASLEASASVSSIMSNRLFDEFLMCLYTPGRHPTASAVKVINITEEGQSTENIKDSDPKTKVVIAGSAVFKNDKLVGYYDEMESFGYTIIRSKTQGLTISFPCDDEGNYGNVAFDSLANKTKINIKNNKPEAILNTSGEATLVEYNCKKDLSKESTITEIEKSTNETIKKILNNTMTKTQQEYKSDVLGFGERLYRENNKYWEKNKQNWDDIFSSMKYKINVKVDIKRMGSLIKAAERRETNEQK